MSIQKNITELKKEIPAHVKIVVVTKTHSADKILEAYNTGHKIFGENRVQELLPKQHLLQKDIDWHLIGHLQTNKVKLIVPFVTLIHSVDSMKLLEEINKCAAMVNRVIDCLLQIHIAQEDTKFGFSFKEAEKIIHSHQLLDLKNIRITGLMGMSTLTEDENKVRKEFKSLKSFFEKLNVQLSLENTVQIQLKTLSMGMSSDYKIAIEEGSNMIRVGSIIFGSRY